MEETKKTIGQVKITQYLHAGFHALWVRTHEEDRFISSLIEESGNYRVFVWDIVDGMRDTKAETSRAMDDPLKPLKHIDSMPSSSILVLKDFHKFIKVIEIFRTIKNLANKMKGSDKHIIIVSPVADIPIELEKDFVLLDFKLPTKAELIGTGRKILTENNIKGKIDSEVCAAAVGLTSTEAENVFALSLVCNKTFDKDLIQAEKLQAVKKSGLLEIYEPISEDQLGGLDNLKNYIHNRKRAFTEEAMPKLRGILLAGLPGAGKSLSAKVISSILDFPLVRLDVGALKGSLVGESEGKMRSALNLIDAISPCVVWLDEIEKMLGGVQSSNKTDGGTTANMFGTLLTWMQESKNKKYMIATCNDIQDLLSISQGALLRRFDDIFFVDVPSAKERKAILGIMNERYGTDVPADKAKDMEGWTGAEIEKFVVASVYDGVDQAFKAVRPILMQNSGLIEKARQWAIQNARVANDRIYDLKQKETRKLATASNLA